MKRVTKIIKNETKEQKGGFLGTLLGTLGANLLGNVLPESGMLSAEFGNKEGKGTLRSGFRSSKKKKKLIPPDSLTNFEIQNYYQNEPRFNGVFCRYNLPKKRMGHM